MKLWCDVLDTMEIIQGEGPIPLTSATVAHLLDGSGGIKLACPVTVRGRELLRAGRRVKIYAGDDEGTAPALLGEGIIKKSGLSGSSITADCQDVLEELKYDNTLLNYQISGDTVQTAVSALIGPLGFTVEASGAALTSTVSLPFEGETKLKALLSVAESAGVHVRLSARGGRVIEVGNFGTTNGLTLFDASAGAGGGADSGVLESLTMEEQGEQLANRILAKGGAFESGAAITLSDSTRAGIDTILGRDGALNYYRADAASVTEYGVRWLYKTYPDIKPLSASAAHRIAAANQLSDAVAFDLVNLAVIRRNYRGKVRGLTTRLLPGDLVRVLYADTIYQDDGSIWPGAALDEALYIIKAETYAGEGGQWQNVELSNVNAQRVDEATDVAISVERSKKV